MRSLAVSRASGSSCGPWQGHELRRGRNFDHALHEDARSHDVLGIEVAEVHDLAHLDDGALCCAGHDRTEVASGLAVYEVAPAVGAQGLDQREVSADRILEHVVAPVDPPRLLALRELRSEAGRRVERADARASGADALGEVALRD